MNTYTQNTLRKIRYYIRLPHPHQARGAEAAFAFKSDGAEGFAEELQAALRSPSLFEQWRAMQPDPDAVDLALGASDPQAQVQGEQSDLAIDLIATTKISGAAFKHRLYLLAGNHWQMRDVTSA